MENSTQQIIKLALYGDSLACPRIGIVESNERYIALVEKHLRKFDDSFYLELRDKSKGGATLPDLFSTYIIDNTYYNLPGDYIIIHSGIVDCAPRPINESFKKRINKLPLRVKSIVIKYIHNNRAKLIKSNKGGFVKTKLEIFEEVLRNFLAHASENYKKVFLINICPTNDKIEAHSPGLKANINIYNEKILEVFKSIKTSNIFLIDIYKELQSVENINNYIVEEDGHHIHPITHKLIAEKIISFLK